VLLVLPLIMPLVLMLLKRLGWNPLSSDPFGVKILPMVSAAIPATAVTSCDSDDAKGDEH
jgi:hypothetical protein